MCPKSFLVSQPMRLANAALLLAGCLGMATDAGAQSSADMAFRYAPDHYQETTPEQPASDYLVAFDYDGDLVATNNWEHLGAGAWPATVYYSVVQTCTHWFIGYAFFHPREWSADSSRYTQHENDMQGVIMSVRKDGSEWGRLEAMLTFAPQGPQVARPRVVVDAPAGVAQAPTSSRMSSVGKFHSYLAPGSTYRAGHASVDGTIVLEGAGNGIRRPMTGATPRDHAVRAWPSASGFNGGPTQLGLIYRPTLGAPTSPVSGNDRYVYYQLVDITGPGGLWQQAIREAQWPTDARSTFAAFGTFRGDDSGGCGNASSPLVCLLDDGRAPWGWDDHDDGASWRGEWALDPANLFSWYFSSTGELSQHYVDNRYLVDLFQAGFDARHGPDGFPPELDLDALYRKLGGTCPR